MFPVGRLYKDEDDAKDAAASGKTIWLEEEVDMFGGANVGRGTDGKVCRG